MGPLLEFVPHLAAMAVLMVASGFFSCSEAALFYLGREQRERMATGTIGERAAAALLSDPERLLTAILFGNLVVNMLFFTLTSVVSIGLTRGGAPQHGQAVAVGALMTIIVVSEMLPKNLGVVWTTSLASLLSLPLAAVTRALDPLLPLLGALNRGSSRVLFPRFAPEPYLELADLERAITLSGRDEQLVTQERNVLSRIVGLADTRIEEIMRPRVLYEALPPPVTLRDLSQRSVASGYVLITEPDSDEIARALDVDRLAMLPTDRVSDAAAPVLPAPWCASAADTLSRLDAAGRHVVAVVNELGETIGIVTRGDLLASVLQGEAARDSAHSRIIRVAQIDENAWEVTGMTTLRRLARQLGVDLPAAKGITVAGMLQEQLNRLPEPGDELEWGGLHWRVITADHPLSLTTMVTLAEPTDEAPEPP